MHLTDISPITTKRIITQPILSLAITGIILLTAILGGIITILHMRNFL